MVYLTGDTHGDIQRFKQGKLRWLGKKDTVVVLGDFGPYAIWQQLHPSGQ